MRRNASAKFCVCVAPVNSGFCVFPTTTRRITAGANSPLLTPEAARYLGLKLLRMARRIEGGKA